jgi:hypothetical protein
MRKVSVFFTNITQHSRWGIRVRMHPFVLIEFNFIGTAIALFLTWQSLTHICTRSRPAKRVVKQTKEINP